MNGEDCKPETVQPRPLENAVSELSALANKMFRAVDGQSTIIEDQFRHIKILENSARNQKAELNTSEFEIEKLKKELAKLYGEDKEPDGKDDPGCKGIKVEPKLEVGKFAGQKEMAKRMPLTSSGPYPTKKQL